MAVQRTYPVRMYPDDFEKLKSQKEETGLPWASFIKVLIKEHEQLNSGEKHEWTWNFSEFSGNNSNVYVNWNTCDYSLCFIFSNLF